MELARTLNDRFAMDVRICVFQGGRVPHERLTQLREPILLEFFGSHWKPRQFLRFRRDLRSVIRDWQPDIIHSHLWPACRWTATALIDMNIPQVWHIHDTRRWLVERTLKHQTYRAWTRWLIRRVSPTIIAVSGAAAEYSATALGFNVKSCEIVSCGVDPNRFSVRQKGCTSNVVVGMAARFRPEKGHDVLLKAARKLVERGLDIELRLAGEGETLESMRQLSATLGLAHNVEFVGHVSDMPGFLADLDLFVLPSVAFEGLPVCLLEAMSMNIPVVATAVAGTGEIVRTNETGVLVPPKDESLLADGIESVIRDYGSAMDRAKNAKKMVLETYTNIATAKKVVRIYEKLLYDGNHENAIN